MNKLKTLFLVCLMTAVSASACWWTRIGLANGNYIAGLNNWIEHFNGEQDYEHAEFMNGMQCALPITAYVGINQLATQGTDPEHPDQLVLRNVTQAILQYRVKRGSTWLTEDWITVRTITNPRWTFESDHPVPVFGTASINPYDDRVPIQAGDAIYIRYYVTDGVIESGDLDDNLDEIDSYSTETWQNYPNYTGGWSPLFVMSVTYNGKRRIGY